MYGSLYHVSIHIINNKVLRMKFIRNRKRKCSDCGENKLYKYFSKSKNNCKKCQSNKDSIRRYGLDNNQILYILDEQNNQCPICLDNIDNRSKANVDHCHDSGAIRGILCQNCNTAVGLLSDNWKNFERGRDYILNFKTRSEIGCDWLDTMV